MTDKAIRCFIAVSLPLDIQAWFSRIQKELKKSRLRASWSNPLQVHITLKFLGGVQAGQIPLIEKSMAQAAQQAAPFSLYGSGLGVFPSVKKPRVFWAGVRGCTDQLEILAKNLDQQLFERLGVKKEKRRFSPHLTLARLKQDIPPEKVVQLMQGFQTQESNFFEAVKIDLIESKLHSSGASHEKIYSARFEK